MATFTAAEDLGGHRLVVLDSSGQAAYADQTNLYHAGRVLGLTTGSAVSGAVATIQTFGEISESSWNWNPVLARVFLSTNGLLTQTPPTSGFLCVVGFPISATRLFIDVQPPVQLL